MSALQSKNSARISDIYLRAVQGIYISTNVLMYSDIPGQDYGHLPQYIFGPAETC